MPMLITVHAIAHSHPKYKYITGDIDDFAIYAGFDSVVPKSSTFNECSPIQHYLRDRYMDSVTKHQNEMFGPIEDFIKLLEEDLTVIKRGENPIPTNKRIFSITPDYGSCSSGVLPFEEISADGTRKIVRQIEELLEGLYQVVSHDQPKHIFLIWW